MSSNPHPIMRKLRLFLFCALLALAPASLLAENAPLSVDDATLSPDSLNFADNEMGGLADAVNTLADHIKVHGYAHVGYDYNTGDESNTFDFKRSLFWIQANINKRWSFLFMHDFSSETQEIYTDYRFHKLLGVRFGQFKNAFSIENPISLSSIELINGCSQAVSYLAGISTDPLFGKQKGRDIGIMLYGDVPHTGLHYEFQLLNGQGINHKDGNSQKDLILKLQYRIIDPLRIVVSGQIGHGHAVGTSDANPNIHIGDNYKRNRISAGAEFKRFPFSLRSEYLKGWDGHVQSQGVYATGSYNIIRNLDAVASYDYFDHNTHLDMRQSNYTIGAQYWFYRKCRIQLQYTRCCPSYKKEYNIFQLQTQVGF